MNPALNMQYVKPLHAKCNGEVLKVLNGKSKRNDTISMHIPVKAYNYGLSCFNFGYHNTRIQMKDTEYSRQIDPFLSITAKDFSLIKQIKNDNITFWNWKAHQNTASRTDRSTTTQTMIPPLKRVISRNYLSETAANF